MVFYGERFRRDDEEDIWEELKRMITNQPTEEEVFFKNKQEQAWIDSVLDKAFPEEPKTQTEGGNLGNSPLGGVKLGKQPLEGFGNATIHGTNSSKKIDGFLDLGKSDDMLKESFAPIEKNKNSNRNAFGGVNNGYEKTQKEPYLRYEDLLSDETAEEREAREVRELKAFNKAWDKANGVEKKDAEGVLTGAAADIGDKIDKFYNILTNKEVDYSAPMTIKDKFTDFAVQNPITRSLYPASSDIYTDGMTNFSRATKNPDAQILENYLGLDPVSQSQLRKYGVTPKHKGVYYDENSNISKLISDSPEIRDFIIKNKDAIQRGEITEFPFEFKTSRKDMLKNKESFDRGNSIQHGKMWDIKINDDNSYSAHVGDLVDYAQRNVKSLGDFMNNHGYNMQEKGNFENYFTLIKLKSWLDDEELRKRRKRRF